MHKRYFGLLGVAAMLIAASGLAPKPAAAQEGQQYYTYVSQFQVPRAQWAAFEKQQQADAASQKKLVADGTLVDFGEIATRVHTPDGYTHADWMTASSRENLLKALEQEWSTATNASYVASTKHQDLFLHTIAHGGKTASDATGYLRVGFYRAKPGHEGDFAELLTKKVKPLLDSAIADGTLLMYNLDTEDIHTSAPGAYNMALLFPDGAAMDKFFSALAAGQKSDPSVSQLLDALTISKEHSDSLGRVTAYGHK